MTARFLLDTQTFILAAQPGALLPKRVRDILLKSDHTLYLSMASLWELQIKLGLQKLHLPVSLPVAVQRGIDSLGIEFLSIYPEHVYRLAELPLRHRDPFDRLLAAQALHEQLTVVSSDKIFDAYAVRRVW